MENDEGLLFCRLEIMVRHYMYQYFRRSNSASRHIGAWPSARNTIVEPERKYAKVFKKCHSNPLLLNPFHSGICLPLAFSTSANFKSTRKTSAQLVAWLCCLIRFPGALQILCFHTAR
jgi:hypothetical protein